MLQVHSNVGPSSHAPERGLQFQILTQTRISYGLLRISRTTHMDPDLDVLSIQEKIQTT